MDLVRHYFLDLLRQSLLQGLRYDGLPSGMGDFAGLRVAAGVVRGIWEFVFDRFWDLLAQRISIGPRAV